jgi:peptide/nickel transport system substrate-binding protein
MRKGLVGLLATTAIVFAACQGAATPSPSPSAAASPSEAATSPSPSPAATPVDYESLLFNYSYNPTPGTPGGTIIISDWQAANQLNYYYSNAFANSEVLAATMRSLATVSNDGHWKGDLASDDQLPKFSNGGVVADASGNGFTVKLAIKPGLLWSDGQPLTLNDLKYTWQWVMDPAQTGIVTLGWDKIDTFDVASDGLSASVHFKENFAGWFGTLLGSPPLPEHYMKTIPIKDANAKSYPVSPAIASAPVSGPFKYVTASSDTIELARNDNFKSGPDGRAPYLDKVTYKFFPDNKDGMIAAFLAGEIDVALDLQQADYDAIKGVDPTVGTAILEPGWSYEHLDMNQAGLGEGKGAPALKDIVVRKAMYQAIDKTALWKTVFPGSPVPEAQACVNATPTNYWQLPNAQCPTYDPAAANAALDAAGYTKGADGIRIDPKTNKPLVFEHCTSTAGFRQTGGEFLAKAMEAIGIKLNLNFVDSTAVFFANWPDVSADTKCNLAHGNYDTAEFAYVLSFDLYGDFYYSYATDQIPTDANKGNGYNYLRFSNPDMDAAMKTLQNAIAPADQVAAAYTAQQVYIDQIPEIPLYYRNDARGVSVKVQNFFYNPSTSSDMWNIEDWWAKQ